MAMDVRKFGHKVRCDFNGCRELASYSIGDERLPSGYRFNVCDKCLQQIALSVPVEMVLKRPDVVDMIKAANEKEVVSDGFGMEGTQEELSLEPDFDNMNMKELRTYIKTKGKTVPVGFTKEEAVQMAKNLDNWE